MRITAKHLRFVVALFFLLYSKPNSLAQSIDASFEEMCNYAQSKFKLDYNIPSKKKRLKAIESLGLSFTKKQKAIHSKKDDCYYFYDATLNHFYQKEVFLVCSYYNNDILLFFGEYGTSSITGIFIYYLDIDHLIFLAVGSSINPSNNPKIIDIYLLDRYFHPLQRLVIHNEQVAYKTAIRHEPYRIEALFKPKEKIKYPVDNLKVFLKVVSNDFLWEDTGMDLIPTYINSPMWSLPSITYDKEPRYLNNFVEEVDIKDK